MSSTETAPSAPSTRPTRAAVYGPGDDLVGIDRESPAPPRPDGEPGADPPHECCAAPHPGTGSACQLCQAPVCMGCMAFANGLGICQRCRDQVASDLAAEQAGAGHLPLAVVGGLGAALVSGIVWAVIAIVTGLAIGYVAVGVGWLAGLGVLHGARKRRGRALQWLAVGCATLGLVLGKYFIVAHALREMAARNGVTVSYVDPRLFAVFGEVLPKILSPFDALWLFLALGVAWGIPRRTEVTLA